MNMVSAWEAYLSISRSPEGNFVDYYITSLDGEEPRVFSFVDGPKLAGEQTDAKALADMIVSVLSSYDSRLDPVYVARRLMSVRRRFGAAVLREIWRETREGTAPSPEDLEPIARDPEYREPFLV